MDNLGCPYGEVAPSLKDPAMVNFCLENNVIGTDNVLRASLAAKVGCCSLHPDWIEPGLN